jgi:hypothetical protein
MKKEEIKCKFKMIHLEDILCLKILLEVEALPYWSMGEKFARLHQASTIKKGLPF